MREASHRILRSLVALQFIVTPALAADLPSHKAPPVAPPAPFTWTGLYVGGDFGYTWTNSPALGVASANIYDRTLLGWGAASALGASGVVNGNLDGFLSGVDLGYNWQFHDRFVAGVEADLMGAGVRGGGGLGTIVPNGAFPGFYAVTGAKLNRNLEYLGTVRARLGYAVLPNVLVYATGGLAYGGANESVTLNQTLAPSILAGGTAKGTLFENRAGWTAGAGVEYALSRNLSAKVEYLYYDLGTLGTSNRTISPLAYEGALFGFQRVADATLASTRFDGHVVRAGLNYRFDWSEPPASAEGATAPLASPRFADATAPAFGDWRFTLMPYSWATAVNGNMTALSQTVGTDLSFIDFLTKTSAMPLSFSGRVEARNGPFGFYGDLAWMQLRFGASTMQLRSPLADIGVAIAANGHLKQTLAIGEAGVSYELARWKFLDAPDSYTAFDAYAGMRYGYLSLDLALNAATAATSNLLGLSQGGAISAAKSGSMEWVDPVVGFGVRHEFAPGQQFQFRGDIGGFGVGSQFSWQAYGGYSRDFEFAGLKFTNTIGYRAVSIDYAQTNGAGRRSGIDAIVHGPVSGLALRF
jgi:opacity protein-like surface antigen